WRVADLEGFLAYFVGRPSLARHLRATFTGRLNTDDANRLEFGFARAVASRGLFELSDILELSRARGEDRLELEDGALALPRVLDERRRLYGADKEWAVLDQPARARSNAYALYQSGDLAGALAAWRAQPVAASSPTARALMAEGP